MVKITKTTISMSLTTGNKPRPPHRRCPQTSFWNKIVDYLFFQSWYRSGLVEIWYSKDIDGKSLSHRALIRGDGKILSTVDTYKLSFSDHITSYAEVDNGYLRGNTAFYFYGKEEE